jgi:hypothetical protein
MAYAKKRSSCSFEYVIQQRGGNGCCQKVKIFLYEWKLTAPKSSISNPNS